MDKHNFNPEIPASLNIRTCSIKEFEVIFKTYYRPLFLFAYGYVMDEMEADDMVQNAFLLFGKSGSVCPKI